MIARMTRIIDVCYLIDLTTTADQYDTTGKWTGCSLREAIKPPLCDCI